MSHRNWYVSAGAVLLTAVLLGGCAAWSNREVPPVLDAAGVSEAEALALPLRKQYELVGERYREFNDFVAQSQRAVRAEEWLARGKGLAYIPARGDSRSSSMRGQVTKDNSYYLDSFWVLPREKRAEELLDHMRAYWESLGWQTTKIESSVAPGEFRVTGIAPDDTWMAFDMMRYELHLSAFSPVYWGDTSALSTAVWNVMQADRADGTEWDPPQLTESGDALILPGEYAPFPQWRDEALADRLDAVYSEEGDVN